MASKESQRTDLVSPDGRPYTAANPVETTNLLARGYKVAKAKQQSDKNSK
jgi:hypothetical protein